MRGFEQFLMDMVEQPEITGYILEKVTTLCHDITVRALEQAQGAIDIV